ncbi:MULTISPECIES: DeoR/GlpR family DNA-binding transcription regulator [Geobacillus]|uniref:Transcriptional regulator n=1 Tax=Geobacillus thermocatenulatus TaxID=33938 RepID=A0A226Q9N6_9BACL|nr:MULTISPECIES: DeoR/GlpR family DNA-binding transcription regulator [Geobacillus]ASS98007.1 transcriptional regulator [Geobacillus thermocatenulatus]KLR74582.1 transcriptional regulator [Geobacillus sp. T6]KPD00303.1 Glucitol operon repressor [Geobacillus sp. BCO2]OXB88754.1 transcriptional regulator [Geobacillus thermocatenulatus]
MLPKERREWIERQLMTQGKVDIEKLSQQLNVSTMTIRRDLAFLEREGKVVRTHGGAIHPQSLIQETPYSAKKEKNIGQKQAIARKAVEFIPENASIILDSGTTTFEVAKLIKHREDLTVVTNDIKIAAELMESSLKVIVTGGELQNQIGTLYGWPTQELLKNIRADLFFLGAHAVDVTSGVTAPTFEKSLIKKLMMQAAESTWLLVDSSKFNQKSFSLVCPLSELEGIITDTGLHQEDQCQYSEHTHIIAVNPEPFQ